MTPVDPNRPGINPPELAADLLESSPEGVLLLDGRWRCIYANPTAERITGVNRVEIIGRSLWDTFPSLSGSAFEEQLTRVATGGKRVTFEFLYAATTRWCDVDAVPLDGRIAVFMRDVTERRRQIDSMRPPVPEARELDAESASPLATILLVDDEDAMRRISRRILTRQGYRVLEAEHGAEALRLAEAHGDEIDVVVTDVLMPGIRGPELVEQLTALYPRVRVLYMSGYTDEDISRWGLQPGIAFIHKPFSADELAEAVRGVLQAAR